MLRKIACNATNSGAIDDEGNVWVWGAGKYGLLGNPKQKNPVFKPIKLQLKSEKLILDFSSDKTFVATSISYGQYHAAIVVNDVNTNSIYNPLLYADSIIQEFKNFMMNTWDKEISSQKEYKQVVFPNDEYKIEHTLKYLFKEEQTTFPYITVESLKQCFVYKAKLSFKDTVSYNKLFQDLSDPKDENRINLKELRDQLIGRRCGNGIVFTWGVLNDGRLGVDLKPEEQDQINSKNHELVPGKPTIVRFDENIIIVKVSCGNSFTVALSQDELCYSWGLGNSGGLGLGDINVTHTPQLIKYQKNGHQFTNIKDVVCGANHCLALKTQGAVFSWGNGQGGRLGYGDETGENVPKEIPYFRENNIKIVIIEAGEQNSAAISHKNILYAWGVGLNGRLGNGKTSNLHEPSVLEDLKGIKVEDVSLGSNHTLCILRNGKALCWGSSKDGKLGLETAMDRNFIQPKELITLEKEKIYQFCAGPFHSIALTEDGQLFTFGSTKDGKLGYEEIKPTVQIPRKIPNLPKFQSREGTNDRNVKYHIFSQYDEQFNMIPTFSTIQQSQIVKICCGFNSTVFLMNEGTLLSCGSNKYGQLGHFGEQDDDKKINKKNEKDSDEEEEEQVEEIKNDDILPLQLKKKLLELELLKDIEFPMPINIENNAISVKIMFVSTSAFHVLAVTTEGLTFGWGRGDYGQLGIGKKELVVPEPTKIKSLQDKRIVMVAAAETHSLFLTDQGEVLSTGFNEFGELGIGTNAQVTVKPDEDELFDEDYQKQIIEAKIELTPKHIKGLESIGYIAAGKNHSIAIRTFKRLEKELRMYTWGCGWYGQIGHGNWNNVYKPKLLDNPIVKDTKFVMASCGAKHTVALDVNGSVWFFGHKHSVGIQDFSDEKQFSPVRLDLPNSVSETIKFISASEDHNLAVSYSGIVYGFGRNTHKKIINKDAEYIYFEKVDVEERAIIAACGANHSAMCDYRGFPYCWGCVANGRCGLSDEKKEEGRQMKDDVGAPQKIQKLHSEFGKVQIELKGIHNHISEFENNQIDLTKLMFPIQKILKEQQQSLDDEILINQDKNLQINFYRMLEEYHVVIQAKNESLLNSFYNAQNAIISRIQTFPTKVDMLTDIKAELPKAIIKNKQLYEGIFTLLQIHPCYLINWITKTNVNRQPKEVLHILKTVFGEKEIQNDERIIHILMAIAKKIFKFEIETYDLKEILWGRTESTFSQLFNLIFENQDANRLFLKNLIKSILKKLQKFFLEMIEHKLFGLEKSKKDRIHLQFDYESVIQQQEDAKFRIRHLIEFMKICLRKMLKVLDPQFKSSKGAGSLSNEIVSLVFAVKEEINLKKANSDISQEEIDSYILVLIFDTLIRKLQDLNYEKIKDYYWDGPQDPDPNVFNFTEKRNLLYVLADHLEIYLRRTKIHYTNQPVEVLKTFIQNGQQNFRRELNELLNIQPLNFDYLLIKDLFVNSMEMRDASLTISINDLIFIYNNLVEKNEIVFIANHENDPISKIIHQLGNSIIEVRQNEKQLISEELLEYKMNLEIRVRLLTKHSVYAKCFDCNGPVYEDLVPQKRFKEGIEGKSWGCQNSDCLTKNDAASIRCRNCGRYRDATTLPKDQMFVRYRQSFNDPAVQIFQRLLVFLPLVGSHQKLDDAINYETKAEESKKDNQDYDKQHVIELFKRYRQEYIQVNKKKITQDDKGLDEKSSLIAAENDFLKYCENSLMESYQGKKNHEVRLQEYYKLMKEIKDKQSNYNQKHQQFNDEFKQISENSYTGLGSEFLKGEKQDIFAGRLHMLAGKKANEGAQKKSQTKQKSNPKLEEFFTQLDKAQSQNNAILMDNYQELQQNREMFRANFGFFGKYPLYLLRQRKILYNIQIHGKKLQTIMKKCSYIFYDDGNNGFRVELIYEGSERKCLVFGETHEAILETFFIEKHQVAEMRRVFATKKTIQYGNSEFNIFELVMLLNEIKSKIYCYGIAEDKEEKKANDKPLTVSATVKKIENPQDSKKDGNGKKKKPAAGAQNHAPAVATKGKDPPKNANKKDNKV